MRGGPSPRPLPKGEGEDVEPSPSGRGLGEGLPSRADLAREAFEFGRKADDPAIALRWLDRAHRLLPADQTYALSLAMACLGRDDARAARLLAGIAEQNDVREVWLALAMARQALGDQAGAARALGHALSRHACCDTVAALAEPIARAAGFPGWCAIGPENRLLAGPPGLQPYCHADHAGQLQVTSAGQLLLGSPLSLAAIRRVEGFVAASHDGGLGGWAWHPGDPDTEPLLTIRPARGDAFTVMAADAGVSAAPRAVLARPRGFRVAPEALAGLNGPFRVLGRDGDDLLGSPLDRVHSENARRETLTQPSPKRGGSKEKPSPIGRGLGEGRPPVDVIVPVHGQPAFTRACLDSVLEAVRRPARVVVIDDASPEPELARMLDRLAACRRIRLIRHAERLGFPAAANAGLRAAAGRDVVLLNSDTIVAPGWIEGLREAAYAAADIGTATPLSNNAGIVSYPGAGGTNPVPDLPETRRLAELASRANAARVVDIPVAVGFCMYIRRDCLDATGAFRADLFAQGYGEENDFCLRAACLGWRHVAAPGVFVAHVGEQSFGAAGRDLRARNAAILDRLYPSYRGMVAAHLAADPLRPARRRLDTARFQAARAGGSAAAILMTHDQGGGVERMVETSAAAHRAAGRRPVVLRPDRTPAGGAAVAVGDGAARGYPNLSYAIPGDLAVLAGLLRDEHPAIIELHQLLGHDPAILELIRLLDVPWDIHVHDYAWLCSRVQLIGPERRYCGEPAIAGCVACVAKAGSLLDETISPAALRSRSARLLRGARRVIAPSEDAAERLRRHFPGLAPTVVAHEDDAAIEEPPLPVRRAGLCRIAVIGAIGIAKGYDVLLACARDAAARALPLEFVVIGHTIDDRRLMATGRAFVTGEFRADEAMALIRTQGASLAFLPSVWPETWCFALSDAWRAGLRVAAFDIGAPAERIRRTGRGTLLPLGAFADTINDVLLATAGLSGQEYSRRQGKRIRPSMAVQTIDASENLNV